MNRNSWYAVVFLTAVWVVLRESFTVATVALGALVSVGCVYLCRKLFPAAQLSSIRPFWLAVYLLYLIGQIYVAGFFVIKLIFSQARTESVEMKTTLPPGFLRTLLANSITLVPGSVSIELQGDTIHALWLTNTAPGSGDAQRAGERSIAKLEKMLFKVHRNEG